jgi:TonB-dependent starch-binding outer membrane protein SusC
MRSVALTRCFGVALCAVAVACGGSQNRGSRPPAPLADSTRASNSITASDIQDRPGQPLEKVLAGKVSGVDVTRGPDGNLSVRIRGATSLNGSSEPLYVLDGVAIQPGPNGALQGLNPEDIESIRVLKDAASTAMYGSRGANGVILIKTKHTH